MTASSFPFDSEVQSSNVFSRLNFLMEETLPISWTLLFFQALNVFNSSQFQPQCNILIVHFALIDKLKTPNRYLHFYLSIKIENFLNKSTTENAMEVSLPSTEFEQQALMITVPKDYKEPISSQSSPSDFSQNSTPFTKIKNRLHGSNASLNKEMTKQEASLSGPSTVIQDSKTPQKKMKFLHLILPIPWRGNTIL